MVGCSEAGIRGGAKLGALQETGTGEGSGDFFGLMFIVAGKKAKQQEGKRGQECLK